MKSVIGSDSLLTSFSMYRMLPSRARSTAWLVGTNTVRGPGPRSGGGAPQFCRKTHIWLTNEDLAQISFKPRCQTEYRINQIFGGKKPLISHKQNKLFLQAFTIILWKYKNRCLKIQTKRWADLKQKPYYSGSICSCYRICMYIIHPKSLKLKMSN